MDEKTLCPEQSGRSMAKIRRRCRNVKSLRKHTIDAPIEKQEHPTGGNVSLPIVFPSALRREVQAGSSARFRTAKHGL